MRRRARARVGEFQMDEMCKNKHFLFKTPLNITDYMSVHLYMLPSMMCFDQHTKNVLKLNTKCKQKKIRRYSLDSKRCQHICVVIKSFGVQRLRQIQKQREFGVINKATIATKFEYKLNSIVFPGLFRFHQ